MKRRPCLAILLAAALAAGCVVHRQIPLDLGGTPNQNDIARQVAAGDRVRVDLRDGRRLTLDVRTIAGDALLGQNGERVPYTDIVRLEREGVDGQVTLILSLVTVALVVLLLANAPFLAAAAP